MEKVCNVITHSSKEALKVVGQTFCREVLLLGQLRHPYILPLYGVVTDLAHNFWLVTPLMKHGNIIAYLSKQDPKFDRIKMVSGADIIVFL